MSKGAWMQGLFLFPIITLAASIAYFHLRVKKLSRDRLRAEAESFLWVGLAAGLFDAAESPADSRIEVALGALARRLNVRAGLVTLGEKNGRRVVAHAALEASLVAGLEKGSAVSADALYCSSIGTTGQLLVINYASLSEWRNHTACRYLGWETYAGIACNTSAGDSIVVSFFDTVPREQLFTQAEMSLVEQFGPWIAAMVEETDIPCAGSDGFIYPERTTAVTGEA